MTVISHKVRRKFLSLHSLVRTRSIAGLLARMPQADICPESPGPVIREGGTQKRSLEKLETAVSVSTHL